MALAASVCISIESGARIKAHSKRIIEEQPLVDQLISAASAASVPHHDHEPSLDELLALSDDLVMPAAARPSASATPLQTATRSKKRKGPEVPATARPFSPATEVHEATLPSAPSKKRKGTEALQHTSGGALQDEVGQNRGTIEAVTEEMMLGNSSTYDLGLESGEVDHSGTEEGVIGEFLNYMVDALKDGADDSLVRAVDEGHTSGGSIEDSWGVFLDDVDFEETMHKYEAEKCTTFMRSGSQLKRIKLTKCCRVARIWSNCDHGKRFLANMIRRFNQLCKRFPSLPRHRIAKVTALQDLGLLPKAVPGKGGGSGIGKWIGENWLPNSHSKGDNSKGERDNSKGERDPCLKNLARLPKAELKKCCADKGLDTTGTGPVLVARLKAHGELDLA